MVGTASSKTYGHREPQGTRRGKGEGEETRPGDTLNALVRVQTGVETVVDVLIPCQGIPKGWKLWSTYKPSRVLVRSKTMK